jgi:hypothetical protein
MCGRAGGTHVRSESDVFAFGTKERTIGCQSRILLIWSRLGKVCLPPWRKPRITYPQMNGFSVSGFVTSVRLAGGRMPFA